MKKLPALDHMFADSSAYKVGKVRLKLIDRHEIAITLKRLEHEQNSRLPGRETVLKAQLTYLLVCLSRVMADREAVENIDPGLANTASGMMNILERAVGTRMSVDEMARDIGYSPEYFSRTFKKLTGISPLVYLNSMRIAAAAETLISTEVPVARATEIAGFDDVNYFSRLFKKETGMTPSDFKDVSRNF